MKYKLHTCYIFADSKPIRFPQGHCCVFYIIKHNLSHYEIIYCSIEIRLSFGEQVFYLNNVLYKNVFLHLQSNNSFMAK